MKINAWKIITIFILSMMIVISTRHVVNADRLDIVQAELTPDGLKPIDVDPSNFWVTEKPEIKLLTKDSILITGPIEPETAKKFKSLLKDNITFIAISSPGGDLKASIEIASEIYNRKLQTVVPPGGECFSGCTIVFQAGEHRIAYKDVMFGYHSAKDVMKDGKMRISTYGTAMYWIALTRMGIDTDIFEYMTDMQTDYFINATNAKRYNIVTSIATD